MGLFKKNVKRVNNELKRDKQVKNELKQEHLEDGNLPWGWVTRNRTFTDKIQNEYTGYLDKWVKLRGKKNQDEYTALEELIKYLEDAEKLCKAKGECFEFWFHEILITPDYIQKRKAELEELKKGCN